MISPQLLAQSQVQTYWRLNRLYALPEGWHWFALAALTLAVLGYIFLMYRRDGGELPRGVKWSLVLLRVSVIAALVFFFLDIEKGAERQHVKNSRVLLVADTSLSMATPDVGDTSATTKKQRIEETIRAVSNDEWLTKLRQDHDLLIYRFDGDPQPELLASLPKYVDDENQAEAIAARAAQRLAEFHQAGERVRTALVAAAVGLVILLGTLLLAMSKTPRELRGWLTLVGTAFLLGGSVSAFVFHLRNSDFKITALIGIQSLEDSLAAEAEAKKSDDDTSKDAEAGDTESSSGPNLNWAEKLKPSGVETRLGDAILALVNQERGGPIAGIAILTDGGQNSGVDISTATLSAKDSSIPVFPIGIGSDKRPTNARVVDIDAPKRAYPRDEFPLTGYVQAYGYEGQKVTVELYALPADQLKDESSAKAPPLDALVADAEVTLEADGSVTPVRFKTNQEDEGRFAYVMRIAAPKTDQDAKDNQKSALVEVIDQKTNVLIMAGGPSREFRFLRNQLFRDAEISSHVWLQSGRPGMSQEADKLLFEFPPDIDTLFEYDVIIAFDPDWMALSETQVEMLEKWLAEKAGGMIVVAGPVNTPRWANLTRDGDARIAKIKAWYPVVFYSWRSATLSLGRFGGTAAWPLQFSQDGMDAEFLWLAEDAIASESTWANFEGVYGYYAVKDPKLGARVYARFSDPDTALDGELPIYLAGHFYGAGRVFFQASGEMWRVREIDDTYFHQYYTKLIRWAAQGRLLRDSKHGVLLVDKERCLIGDHLAVSALLFDEQHRPLSIPSTTASLRAPDGTRTDFVLRQVKDSAREGMYSGQFTATQEGAYRVELIPPESPDQELLTRIVRARVPALETERPQRNDELLRELANKTNGGYFIGVDSAQAGLASSLTPADQETFLPGVPDRGFSELLRTWLLILVSTALSLEWIIRRLNKLA